MLLTKRKGKTQIPSHAMITRLSRQAHSKALLDITAKNVSLNHAYRLIRSGKRQVAWKL